MADIEQYIEDGLKIVAGLIKQGNLNGAFANCQELLKVNPFHRKVQKYLKEIQDAIVSLNEKKVDADIDATMHFWDEGRYEDLVKIYSKLYAFTPQYPRLRSMIEKLNEKLNETQRDARQEFFKKSSGAIKQLLNEKRYPEMIQACNELLSMDPSNADGAVYLNIAKDLLIEQKLKENERVVEGTDFQRSLDFYNSLLAIDPNHPHVKELALQAKEQLAQQRLLAEKIHLNESIARMKDLFVKAEYEMVVQAAEEIDRLDSKNFTAKSYKAKAISTMKAESNRLILKKMAEGLAELTPEYQKNPQGFVVI